MTTELDAVNHILRTVGLGLRLATSTVNLHPQAISAQATLLEVSKDVQAEGHWFNTVTLTLSPNEAGALLLPTDTLSADPVNPLSVLVQRGTKLFDPSGNTYNIGESVSTCIVSLLPIDELPHQAASMIKHKAALQHYENRSNDGSKSRALSNRLVAAQLAFEKEVLHQADTNAFQSPTASRITNRSTSSNESAIHNTLYQ